MRILTLAEDLDAHAGLERAQLQACRELSRRGHRIELLYTRTGGLLGEWEAITARRVRVPGYRISRERRFASGAAILATAGVLRRLAPDLVYLHSPYHAPSVALSGWPAVCHLHLPPPPKLSAQDRFGLSRMQAFVSVSRFTAAQWSSQLGRGMDNFAVVPNAVDVARFRPSSEEERRALRRTMGLPEDRFLVLYSGRIVPEKGLDCALEAMRLLPADRYHLAVAGTSNAASFGGSLAAASAYEAELRSRYADVAVSWLGQLGEVAALMAAADALVLPSRWPEPFGLVVLEALASGVPVVASAVGGIVEILTGALAENLIAPEDPRALAERLRLLHARGRRRSELTLLGRRHVEASYTLSAMGSRLNQAIVQLELSPGRAAGRRGRRARALAHA